MKEIYLTEIAEIVKTPIKNKIYPKGVILIQTSATKGEVLFLENAQTVESKYCLIIPMAGIEPAYLHLVIQRQFPKFLYCYGSGLNFRADELKHFKLTIHQSLEKQRQIVNVMRAMG